MGESVVNIAEGVFDWFASVGGTDGTVLGAAVGEDVVGVADGKALGLNVGPRDDGVVDGAVVDPSVVGDMVGN